MPRALMSVNCKRGVSLVVICCACNPKTASTSLGEWSFDLHKGEAVIERKAETLGVRKLDWKPGDGTQVFSVRKISVLESEQREEVVALIREAERQQSKGKYADLETEVKLDSPVMRGTVRFRHVNPSRLWRMDTFAAKGSVLDVLSIAPKGRGLTNEQLRRLESIKHDAALAG